jgi:hypothetical protein
VTSTELFAEIERAAAAGEPLRPAIVAELRRLLVPGLGGRHARLEARLADAMIDIRRAVAVLANRAGGPRHGGKSWFEAEADASEALAGTPAAGAPSTMQRSRLRVFRHLDDRELRAALIDVLGISFVAALDRAIGEPGFCGYVQWSADELLATFEPSTFTGDPE